MTKCNSDIIPVSNGIQIQLYDVLDDGSHKTRLYGVGSALMYKLCRFCNHYYVNELTEYTKYYIENIDALPINKYNCRSCGAKIRKAEDSKYYLTTSELIPMLCNKGCFRDMTYEEYIKFPQIRYRLSNADPLEYTEALGTKAFNTEEPRMINKNRSIWFADFESTTDGDRHEAFMVCYSNEDGSKHGHFCGQSYGKLLLDMLPDGANVHFHNLAYDGRLMAMYGVASTVQKGSKIYTMKLYHHGKCISLKDSLCLLQMPLRAFPSAFRFDDSHKEVFPYNY
jgi:hypothetical protein